MFAALLVQGMLALPYDTATMMLWTLQSVIDFGTEHEVRSRKREELPEPDRDREKAERKRLGGEPFYTFCVKPEMKKAEVLYFRNKDNREAVWVLKVTVEYETFGLDNGRYLFCIGDKYPQSHHSQNWWKVESRGGLARKGNRTYWFALELHGLKRLKDGDTRPYQLQDWEDEDLYLWIMDRFKEDKKILIKKGK